MIRAGLLLTATLVAASCSSPRDGLVRSFHEHRQGFEAARLVATEHAAADSDWSVRVNSPGDRTDLGRRFDAWVGVAAVELVWVLVGDDRPPWVIFQHEQSSFGYTVAYWHAPKPHSLDRWDSAEPLGDDWFLIIDG